MVGHLTPIIWPQNLLMVVIALHDLSQSGITAVKAIKCYSCANDFIVWHWRHFFLKRNYGITVSDQNCVKPDYTPEMSHLCPSTCFIMYLNGTNRHNGIISTLGVVRGCSSQFLTNDQHSQLGLGSNSRASKIRDHLASEFDMFDIMEHWCFCASDQCNKNSCYGLNPNSRSSSKRRQYFFDTYWSADASPSANYFYSVSVLLSLIALVLLLLPLPVALVI